MTDIIPALCLHLSCAAASALITLVLATGFVESTSVAPGVRDAAAAVGATVLTQHA